MATNSSTRSAFRVVGLLVYVLIGGAIFMQIEKETGRNSKSQTLEDFLRRWSNTYNLSQENITNLLKDYDDTRENGAKPTWTFLNSVFYVLQLVTTIGKKEIVVNFTPKSSTFCDQIRHCRCRNIFNKNELFHRGAMQIKYILNIFFRYESSHPKHRYWTSGTTYS